MTGGEAALWGLLGGFTVEGLELYAAIRRRGCWPWQTGEPQEASRGAYLVAELVRLLVGAGLAAAAAESGQVATAVAALAVGIAAPLIVDRLARAVPLSYADQPTANTMGTAASSSPTVAATPSSGGQTTDRPPADSTLVPSPDAQSLPTDPAGG